MGQALAVVGGDGGELVRWGGGALLVGAAGVVADVSAGASPLNAASLYELFQLAVLVFIMRQLNAFNAGVAKQGKE